AIVRYLCTGACACHVDWPWLRTCHARFPVLNVYWLTNFLSSSFPRSFPSLLLSFSPSLLLSFYPSLLLSFSTSLLLSFSPSLLLSFSPSLLLSFSPSLLL